MSDDRQHCLFVDIETTGLYPYGNPDTGLKDHPLEIGCVLTDLDLNVVDTFQSLVTPLPGWKQAMPQFVVDMHTKNDLIRDLEALFDSGHGRRRRPNKVDGYLCDWLDSHEIPVGQLPMHGSSTGSLDRPFSQAYFPLFNRHTSYRNVDVSSFKEECKTQNPELYAKLKDEIGDKADSKHRVIDDCFAAMNELAVYRREFLII